MSKKWKINTKKLVALITTSLHISKIIKYIPSTLLECRMNPNSCFGGVIERRISPTLGHLLTNSQINYITSCFNEKTQLWIGIYSNRGDKDYMWTYIFFTSKWSSHSSFLQRLLKLCKLPCTPLGTHHINRLAEPNRWHKETILLLIISTRETTISDKK